MKYILSILIMGVMAINLQANTIEKVETTHFKASYKYSDVSLTPDNESTWNLEEFKEKYNIRNIDVLIGSKHTVGGVPVYNPNTHKKERYEYNEINPGVSVTLNNGFNFGCLENSYYNLSCHIGYEHELYKTGDLTFSAKGMLMTGYYDTTRPEMSRVNKLTKGTPFNLLPVGAIGVKYNDWKLGISISKNPVLFFSYSF